MSLNKSEFNEYMCARGYKKLKEVSLDKSESNTIFVGSSIMANMNLLNRKNKFGYVTTQRVFSGKRLDDIGKYPLATPFEVMMSVFKYDSNAFADTFVDIIDFLDSKVGISKKDIIVLAPNDYEVNRDIQSLGINTDLIVHWEKDLPLFLNKNNTGKYIKLFYPYNNGIVPIGTLGLIKKGSFEFIDSALFLERLSFIKDKKANWFEDYYFKETMDALDKMNISSSDSMTLAIYLRTLLALYNDKITVANTSAGYVVKKMIRKMFTNSKIDLLLEENIEKVMIAISKDLSKLDYFANTTTVKTMIFDINDQMKKYKKSQMQAVKKLKKLSSKRNVSKQDLIKLHDEQGLSIKEIKNWGIEKGIDLTNTFEEPQKYWLRNELYKFNNSNRQERPEKIIEKAGARRL